MLELKTPRGHIPVKAFWHGDRLQVALRKGPVRRRGGREVWPAFGCWSIYDVESNKVTLRLQEEPGLDETDLIYSPEYGLGFCYFKEPLDPDSDGSGNGAPYTIFPGRDARRVRKGRHRDNDMRKHPWWNVIGHHPSSDDRYFVDYGLPGRGDFLLLGPTLYEQLYGKFRSSLFGYPLGWHEETEAEGEENEELAERSFYIYDREARHARLIDMGAYSVANVRDCVLSPDSLRVAVIGDRRLFLFDID